MLEMDVTEPNVFELDATECQLLSQLPIETILSWEQLEMYAAINNCKISKDFITLLLIMSIMYENVQLTLCNAFQSGIILKYFNSPEAMIQMVQKTLDQNTLAEICRKSFSSSRDKSTPVSAYLIELYYSVWNSSQDSSRDWRRRFSTAKWIFLYAIDATYPLSLLSFYNTHVHELHQHDPEFVRRLAKHIKKLAEKDVRLIPILAKLEKNMQKEQSRCMHLS